MNFQTIFQLDDLRSHRAQIVRDRRDAIGFFYAQFLGLTNNRRAARERAGHGEHRQLIDQLRNFFSLNDGPFSAAPVTSTAPRGSS